MISIIIPTYNRAKLLPEALSPLLGISEPHVECIVVDDASTDDTAAAIETLRNHTQVENLVYIQQSKNLGAQAARNAGIAAASGDYFLFMDSDDVPVISGIKNLYSHLLRNSHLDYSYGLVTKTDSGLKPLGGNDTVGSRYGGHASEIAGYHWHTMGALYRRKCVEMVGPWNPELSGSQDWEYQARVKIYGGKGDFIETLVGYWRQHEGERVGTYCFRPDYNSSVMIACDSILQHARDAGRCDPQLELRLAKKLVLHALEWGSNKYHTERNECIDQAVLGMTKFHLCKIIIKMLKYMPKSFDKVLHMMITKMLYRA
jgi:glycosyltransferase involved in cell wall biosynthesis